MQRLAQPVYLPCQTAGALVGTRGAGSDSGSSEIPPPLMKAGSGQADEEYPGILGIGNRFGSLLDIYRVPGYNLGRVGINCSEAIAIGGAQKGFRLFFLRP